jgi:alpha-tubulin suppressor-like RCC1 family protein
VLPPMDVLGVGSVVDVGLGDEHGCILDQANVVSCWGLNGYGQCGSGTKAYLPLGPVVW